jgi:hypothetical protein
MCFLEISADEDCVALHWAGQPVSTVCCSAHGQKVSMAGLGNR